MTFRGASAGFPALLKSPLVLSGLLLICIGLGETVIGRTKIREYEAELRRTPAVTRTAPAALFPRASEEQEERELAEAKFAYYHLLLTAGQLIAGLGLILFAAGLLRGYRPRRAELTSA